MKCEDPHLFTQKRAGLTLKHSKRKKAVECLIHWPTFSRQPVPERGSEPRTSLSWPSDNCFISFLPFLGLLPNFLAYRSCLLRGRRMERRWESGAGVMWEEPMETGLGAWNQGWAAPNAFWEAQEAGGQPEFPIGQCPPVLRSCMLWSH